MGKSIIPSKDLEEDIDRYIRMGYRIDMIMPADAPREVLLSKGGESVRLRSKNRQRSSNADHVTGRAGMMYRDLIPGRAGGRIVASHIRLAEDGPVPDYIHYHKIQFQMIYCLRGRIRVVYEDQGPPFWLEAGDCVLQPPEIRHRVLESSGQAEVVEVSMPAVHETWVEHEIELPTSDVRTDRDFDGQRFCRYVRATAEWRSDADNFEYSDTGIGEATLGLANVRLVRSAKGGQIRSDADPKIRPAFYFCFVTDGEINATSQGIKNINVKRNENVFFPKDIEWSILVPKDTSFLEVSIPV